MMPSAFRVNNVVAVDICFSLCALVTIALFVTANLAITGICFTARQRMGEVELSPEVLGRLGQAASARELVAIRQRILQESNVF
jgi:hypothetical protein